MRRGDDGRGRLQRALHDATALLRALSKKDETEGQLTERLAFYCRPKLLIVDELGYLPG